MNKQKAIEAMNIGEKVRHRAFAKEEWIKKAENRVYRYETEDGCIHKIEEFWEYRTHPGWEEDWEVVID